ncbi:hypothetical protein EDB84DRAFT_1680775, partial [Lactarius hengduanensis]
MTVKNRSTTGLTLSALCGVSTNSCWTDAMAQIGESSTEHKPPRFKKTQRDFATDQLNAQTAREPPGGHPWPAGQAGWLYGIRKRDPFLPTVSRPSPSVPRNPDLSTPCTTLHVTSGFLTTEDVGASAAAAAADVDLLLGLADEPGTFLPPDTGRWRSEVTQPYHSQPQNQRAFILNDQRWFALRRFGNLEGAGYWFNLNSFLDRPEWIGETYLGMVLQQAEAEGKTTDGDVIATTLPPPASSGSQHLSTVHTPQPPAGLEDEDLQLQAALQASLGEAGEGEVSWKRTGSSMTAGGVDTLTPSANTGFPSSSLLLSPPPIPPPSTRPAEQSTGNPVATSMARNQALLERMRREQEAATARTLPRRSRRFRGRSASQ